MHKLLQYLSRNPLIVAGAVGVALIVAIASVTYYVQHTVRPRQEAALRLEIETRIAKADELAGRERYEPALNEFRYLLGKYADRLDVGVRGHLQHQIGVCYAHLGERKEDQATLEKALAAYQDALALRTRDRDPAGYGETERALGALHRVLAEKGAGEKGLHDAVSSYRAALAVYDPAAQPEDFGATQRELAETYHLLFRANPDRKLIQPAEDAYKAALSVFSRDVHPREFAETEVQRGVTYLDFAKAMFPGSNTKKAIEALESALSVYKSMDNVRSVQTTYRHLAAAYTEAASVTEAPGIRMKYELDARRATYLAGGSSLSDKAAIDAQSDRIRTTD